MTGIGYVYSFLFPIECAHLTPTQALWAIQGNYYVRDGQVDKDEPWGLLNADWTAWRNPAVRDVLGKMFDQTQGP